MCAQVNARESDEQNGQGCEREREAAQKGAARQKRVSREEEEAEIGHIKRDVARGKAIDHRVCVALYEVWRGTWSRNQGLEYCVDETASASTESQSKGFASPAKEQKENHRQSRQRVRRPTVAEDRHEAHQGEKA